MPTDQFNRTADVMAELDAHTTRYAQDIEGIKSRLADAALTLETAEPPPPPPPPPLATWPPPGFTQTLRDGALYRRTIFDRGTRPGASSMYHLAVTRGWRNWELWSELRRRFGFSRVDLGPDQIPAYADRWADVGIAGPVRMTVRWTDFDWDGNLLAAPKRVIDAFLMHFGRAGMRPYFTLQFLDTQPVPARFYDVKLAAAVAAGDRVVYLDTDLPVAPYTWGLMSAAGTPLPAATDPKRFATHLVQQVEGQSLTLGQAITEPLPAGASVRLVELRAAPLSPTTIDAAEEAFRAPMRALLERIRHYGLESAVLFCNGNETTSPDESWYSLTQWTTEDDETSVQQDNWGVARGWTEWTGAIARILALEGWRGDPVICGLTNTGAFSDDFLAPNVEATSVHLYGVKPQTSGVVDTVGGTLQGPGFVWYVAPQKLQARDGKYDIRNVAYVGADGSIQKDHPFVGDLARLTVGALSKVEGFDGAGDAFRLAPWITETPRGIYGTVAVGSDEGGFNPEEWFGAPGTQYRSDRPGSLNTAEWQQRMRAKAYMLKLIYAFDYAFLMEFRPVPSGGKTDGYGLDSEDFHSQLLAAVRKARQTGQAVVVPQGVPLGYPLQCMRRFMGVLDDYQGYKIGLVESVSSSSPAGQLTLETAAWKPDAPLLWRGDGSKAFPDQPAPEQLQAGIIALNQDTVAVLAQIRPERLDEELGEVPIALRLGGCDGRWTVLDTVDVRPGVEPPAARLDAVGPNVGCLQLSVTDWPRLVILHRAADPMNPSDHVPAKEAADATSAVGDRYTAEDVRALVEESARQLGFSYEDVTPPLWSGYALCDAEGGLDFGSFAATPDEVRQKVLEAKMGWRFEYPSRFNQEAVWHRLLESRQVIPVSVFQRCPRPNCPGVVGDGVATESTAVGKPDFVGDDPSEAVTLSTGGPGRLIPCRKCRICGHSTY